MSELITRFAPSPTGYLHVGNARMALINWLFSRHYKGRFILRIDDTDVARSDDKYTQSIKHDLQWLGLDWDETFHQAARQEKYDQAVSLLKSLGRLYPCYETPEELSFKRKRQLAKGQPPKYDRGALALTPDVLDVYEKEGRKPHWRFKLEEGEIVWEDLIHGRLSFQASNLSDPILIKSGGLPVFTLATVVDDMEKGVTHVIRGDDHISNTALQIQILEALGGDASKMHYGHLPLLMDKDGGSLSKRLGSQSLHDFQKEGIEPQALASLLATMGTSDPIHYVPSLEAMIAAFDLSKFSSATPKFDENELKKLSQEALQHMDIQSINRRLSDRGFEKVDEDVWQAIAPNVSVLEDIASWQAVLEGDIDCTPCVEVPSDFYDKALELLPQTEWGETSWSLWMNAMKDATGLKGRKLIMPLRLALTGREHGPEMKTLLLLLGEDTIRKRLEKIAV